MSGANNIKLNLSDDVKKAIVNSFVNFVNTGNANSSTSNTSNSTSNTSDLQKYLANNEIYNNKKKLLKSNYDQNNASLLQNYNAQSQGLEQNKKDSQQAATIAHQKLLKYLPEYNASMGLYGNGASESALLDANARYRSTQGQIAANYNSQKAQLDADHSARQASLLQNYNQDQMDLYSEAAAKYEADQAKAEAKAEAEEAKEKAGQENLYNMALNTINGWTGSSGDLEDYFNGLDGRLTADQLKSLEQVYYDAKKVVSEDEKYTPQDISAAGNIKVTPPDNYSKGKNFTVKVGNSEYAVQIGDEISSGAAKTTAINGNVGDGEVFAYGGELYIKNGESVYRVEKRFWGSDKYADLKTAVGLSA